VTLDPNSSAASLMSGDARTLGDSSSSLKMPIAG